MKAELPKIISVDDHVVEPAHLWQTWLPSKFRDRGPRSERRGIGSMRHVGGGTYEQTFDPNGPQADCWIYEDLVYINKRHVAAVGFDRDDMTMSPITYDEMRPGCYEPKARLADMDINHDEASLSFPTFPRFCGQTFTEAKDRELGEACDSVKAVVIVVTAISVHLDQQMFAVRLDAGALMTGERGELALELSGLSLYFERWHGV